MSLPSVPDAFAESKDPCAPDAVKFCKDIKSGGGRIAKCLREHENELSAACKEEIAAIRKKRNPALAVCKADAERFCKDVRPGAGGIVKCLEAHEGDLSAQCKKELPSLRREPK